MKASTSDRITDSTRCLNAMHAARSAPPRLRIRLVSTGWDLELLETRTFSAKVDYLRYRVARQPARPPCVVAGGRLPEQFPERLEVLGPLALRLLEGRRVLLFDGFICL